LQVIVEDVPLSSAAALFLAPVSPCLRERPAPAEVRRAQFALQAPGVPSWVPALLLDASLAPVLLQDVERHEVQAHDSVQPAWTYAGCALEARSAVSRQVRELEAQPCSPEVACVQALSWRRGPPGLAYVPADSALLPVRSVSSPAAVVWPVRLVFQPAAALHWARAMAWLQARAARGFRDAPVWLAWVLPVRLAGRAAPQALV
jgi:hypothetical protein